MVELMSHGVVLSRKDIRDLTVEIMNSSSSSNVTGTINQTRKIKGHPDFLVGSGKYRGTGIYFDASLEPEQIDFNGVIDRIDTWKEHRVRRGGLAWI